MKKGLKLSIYLFGFLLMIFYPNIFSSSIAIVFERFVFALLFVFVITDLAFSQKPTFNLDKYKWMDYFGQLSFGLYCYHGVTMTFFIKLSEYLQFTSNTLFVIIILPTLAFTSTLFLAHISYQYFEKPILKMKQKFN